MTLDLDPDLDLRIDRVIRAPRARVWKAWTEPVDLARWWLPAPTQCRTSMSDDGVSFGPHLDACFVVVEPGERLVFTNALDSRWRPANPAPVAMTAEVTFGDHPQGTNYRVVVRHADAASRTHHEQLGFADGWGTVTGQLAALAEAQDGDR